MKRNQLYIALLALLGASCAPSYMVKQEKCPDLREFKPQPGKAALVIGRTTKMGWAVNYAHYLNRDFIGSTRGYSFFVTPMDTGDQFITRDVGGRTVYIKAAPYRTYYVQNGYDLEQTTGEAMFNEMEGDCSFYVRDSTQKVDGLDADDWAEAQKARH